MITDLLPLLRQVKSSRAGQWMAACPAHHDRHPSLSLRLLADGRVLIKCWAGCHVRDIVAALRLDMRVLFPSTCSWPAPARDTLPQWRIQALRDMVQLERLILSLFQARVDRGILSTAADRKRVLQATSRLELLAEHGVIL